MILVLLNADEKADTGDILIALLVVARTTFQCIAVHGRGRIGGHTFRDTTLVHLAALMASSLGKDSGEARCCRLTSAFVRLARE